MLVKFWLFPFPGQRRKKWERKRYGQRKMFISIRSQNLSNENDAWNWLLQKRIFVWIKIDKNILFNMFIDITTHVNRL